MSVSTFICILPPTDILLLRKSGRFLTGIYAGSLRTLRRLYLERFGPVILPRRFKPGLLPWRIGNEDLDLWSLVNDGAITVPDSKLDTSIPLPSQMHPCSFLANPQCAEAMKQYHIVFRFISGCESPRSVDGKIAWTTGDTRLSPSGEVRLSYRTQDGGARLMDEFVPQASLILCSPGVGKGEMALVVEGVDSGKIVFPSRIARDEKKIRTGLYCKLEQKDKKKDEKLYTINQITRIVSLSHGPPGS